MNSIIGKRIYSTPHIVAIQLDNEISLALTSAPPAGPDEGAYIEPNYFNSDHFKNNLA